jgi:hypothetical protein
MQNRSSLANLMLPFGKNAPGLACDVLRNPFRMCFEYGSRATQNTCTFSSTERSPARLRFCRRLTCQGNVVCIRKADSGERLRRSRLNYDVSSASSALPSAAENISG